MAISSTFEKDKQPPTTPETCPSYFGHSIGRVMEGYEQGALLHPAR